MNSRRLAILVLLVMGFGIALWASVRYAHRVGRPSADARPAADVPIQLFRDPKPVPSFTLTTLEGGTISSSSLRGKVVLINFWATWCPPCRAEIPDLIALQAKYADHLVVIGISEDEEPADAVKAFARQVKINYPVAMTTPEIEKLFPGVSSLPTSVVVDREGRMVQRHVGLLNAAMTEQETRVLAGLTLNARIERIDPDKPVGLANAAQAKEIPGVDLASLTSGRRVEALQKLNTDPCTCGCGLTVARCRVDDPQCSVSLPLARKIVDEIVAAR